MSRSSPRDSARPERADDGSAKTCPAFEEIIRADAVLVAFGYKPSPPGCFEPHNIALHPGSRVPVSASAARAFQATNWKVFAGGDRVRGSDLILTAVFEGREAARGRLDYLGVV